MYKQKIMTNNNDHVLVIEDNEDIVVMLKTMLEMKGYRVTATMELKDPLTLIRNVSPDLLLMDMLLSGADGRDICKLVKQSGGLIANLPVIMISAHPDAKKECLAAGADYFLEKPFDMDVFFKVVENALKQKNS